MTQEKAPKAQMTVKAADTVADGKGGFLPVGAKFEPVDAAARKSLADKGLAA